MNPNNPIIVQSDRTILLEVDHPLHAEARDALAQFAELEKSPEHIHTYRLSPLSLWNAAAGGLQAQAIIDLLSHYDSLHRHSMPADFKFIILHSLASVDSEISSFDNLIIQGYRFIKRPATNRLRNMCLSRWIPLLYWWNLHDADILSRH